MAEDFTLDFEGAEVGTLLAGARTLINGDAVRYSPQSASEAQKKQARGNIGAASTAEVSAMKEENAQTIAYLVEELNRQLTEVQGKLVSGENIKTINGESVLGSGNISTSIDVSALFVVGGKMQVAGTDLLTHHLYVRTDNYISNASVVIGNREYILEAKKRASLTTYDTVSVKAIVSYSDGEGLATCIDVIME